MSPEQTCTHLDQVEVSEVPARTEVPGCEECLKMGGQIGRASCRERG